ncbi:MAG: branched-chain amino acid aminotransferase [Candidatus Eisenbacteria bacterium]|uniref:branched-chain-amino-acid transaminase n=1 Tax=Eiseniibacteriota bacterium TaxID=2212470 RepID=A0A948W8Z1_UNCEI|nr:branched-chain amino acid aminotransferase [Candidatus Eisenbacteria bacterium]MBU1951069.1 branched-chain amino acid aminotransferase [Candidatus Eisenbacteria bacterium]MBU2693206.1 branched-chain amino acid aminotransferase [Candidatus Eisenbacteria bacterium]
MGIAERVHLDWASLPFGYSKTDVSIRYTWREGEWDNGVESREEYFPIHIAATALHYGQAAFEGLKVFCTKDNRALGFRIEENAKRMQHSGEMLMMEAPSVELFRKAVHRMVKANQRFIPPYGSGASLYVRPLLFGTGPRIGVKPADEYTFMVLVTPVGPYFKSGFTPTRLIIEESFDRAAPKGVGTAKAAGNYGAGMRATVRARRNGYGEALYLDAKNHRTIDELGAANFFGITSDKRYVTPNSPTVLRSITNMSLRTIAKELGYRVEEREVPVEELDSFIETGACGTAAVITPIESITFRDREIVYLKDGKPGQHCTALYRALTDIQHGDAPDPHGWTEEIEM